MRELSVASETMRPCQIASNSSSLLTIRLRFADEVNKEVEHLRLDVNDRAGAPHLLSCEVDLEIGEA